MPPKQKSGARRGVRGGIGRIAKPPGYEGGSASSPAYRVGSAQQTTGPSWSFPGGINTPTAATAYYNACLAEVRAVGKGRKRPAEDGRISGPATKKQAVRLEPAATAASTVEEIDPSTLEGRPGWKTLSRPYHPVVKAALAAAGPLRRIGLEEKLRLELGNAKRRLLQAKTEVGNWQFETACAQTELNNERNAATLGWKLLCNQKARIDQLEAETITIKQRAAEGIAEHDAEIAELKKKLVAKDERIKKAFME